MNQQSQGNAAGANIDADIFEDSGANNLNNAYGDYLTVHNQPPAIDTNNAD